MNALFEIRKGEIGWLFDEIQNLVEPIERRTMDGPAGPQRRQEPKRCGRSRASGPPWSSEGRVSRTRRTPLQDVVAGPASEAGQRSVAVRTA
jgi:hypothetical protein